MAFLSLYRKYRSQSFEDLKGQDHVVSTLRSALSQGRIAHAYLFTGPRGTGKTSTARLLAKALCCENGPTPNPCNTCDVCVSITQGSCMDVVEMDAASESGVDEIRESIVSSVTYQPAVSKYKVYIIDEVHDLSGKAFDALLKTIEEPPPHAIFILATTEYSKVPPTIRSRCQKYEFHRATTNELVSRLTYVAESEGFEFEPAALGAIARMADGAYRDALTLLEQAALSTSEGGITLAHVYDQLGLIQDDAADAILISLKEGDFQTLSEKFNEILRLGRDPRSIVEGLLFRASELTRALHMVGEDVDASIAAAAHATAVRIGSDELLTIRALLADTHRTINNVTLPRIWLEAELIRVSKAVQSAKAGAAQTPIATKREEPVAKAPAERPVQRSVEPAKPPIQQEKPQTPPAEKAVVEVPEGNSIQAKWARVLAAGSKAFQAKLADVEVELQGNMLTLFFPGRLSHDWVSEDPRKVQYIREKVAGEFGKDVEIVLAIRKPQISDAPAVELELQGQALYEEAKKLTQGNNE